MLFVVIMGCVITLHSCDAAFTLQKKSETLSKEKEDMSKENLVLSKQLEDAKQGVGS